MARAHWAHWSKAAGKPWWPRLPGDRSGPPTGVGVTPRCRSDAARPGGAGHAQCSPPWPVPRGEPEPCSAPRGAGRPAGRPTSVCSVYMWRVCECVCVGPSHAAPTCPRVDAHVHRANTAPHTPFSKRGHLCPSSAPALSTERTVRSWKLRTRMASSWSLPQKSVQTRGRVTLRSHLASLLPPERPAGPRSPRVAGHWGADAEGPCARWSPRHRRVGGQDCRGGGGGTPLLI